MKLKNKRILITGASRGIGRALALLYAQEGAIVGANYLQSKECAESLRSQAGSSIHLTPFDVADDISASAAIHDFASTHGGLDCLINCAGLLSPNLLIKSSVAEIRRQIDINLLGTIICSRAAVPIMLKQHQGLIINISSVASERPTVGQVVYASTKAGIDGFTRALACEYGRKNISVISLRLGPVETDMIRAVLVRDSAAIVSRLLQQRIAQPEDVAKFALTFIAEPSSFATGCLYSFDGGYLVT